MPLCDANDAFDGLEKMFRKNVQEACANPMSGAGSRDRHSLILKYNYFLNSLDLSLSSEATPNETLTSQPEVQGSDSVRAGLELRGAKPDPAQQPGLGHFSSTKLDGPL